MRTMNLFTTGLVACAVLTFVGCEWIKRSQPEATTEDDRPVKRSRGASDGPATLPLGIYPYPESGAFIGQGWDTFHEAGTTASCVEVEQEKLEQSSFALDVREVISSYSLLRTVRTSVSASYKGFGAKASGSVSTSQSRQVKTDDQNVLFNYESLDGSTFAVPVGNRRTSLSLQDSVLKMLGEKPNALESINNAFRDQKVQYGGGAIKLTEYAKNLLHDTEEFRRVCGEGFVSAIHRGSRIQLLLTQAMASETEKNSLRMSLSASGYGASGSASYARSSATTATSSKLGYRIFQEGGIPIKPETSASPNALFDVNRILPTAEQLMANPTAFRVVVTPYGNINSGGTKLPTPIAMMTLGDYYIALNDVYSLVRDMLASAQINPESGTTTWVGINNTLAESYGGISHLEFLSDEIRADMALLEMLISECYVTMKNCTIESATAAIRTQVEKEITGRRIGVASSDVLSERVNNLRIEIASIDRNMMLTQRDSKARDEFQSKLDALDEARYDQRLKEIQESITERDELSYGFFLRFYWYLTQIPVPESALNPNMTVPHGTDVAERAKALNAAIQQTVMSQRIGPWKNFFCHEVKKETLCVPDELLREMTTQFAVRVDGDAFKVSPPPPPPRGRDCGFLKHRCW